MKDISYLYKSKIYLWLWAILGCVGVLTSIYSFVEIYRIESFSKEFIDNVVALIAGCTLFSFSLPIVFILTYTNYKDVIETNNEESEKKDKSMT